MVPNNKDRYIALNYYFEPIPNNPAIIQTNSMNMQFRRRYNEIGSFQVQLNNYDYNFSIDTTNHIYYIYDKETKEMYVVYSVEYNKQEQGAYHIISGYDAMSFLKGMCLGSSTMYNIELRQGVKIYDILYSLMYDNILQPAYSFANSTMGWTGSSEIYNMTKKYYAFPKESYNVYDISQGILNDVEGGKKIEFDFTYGSQTNHFHIRDYIGHNRSQVSENIAPYVFAEDMENIKSINYTEDRSDVKGYSRVEVQRRDWVVLGEVTQSKDYDTPYQETFFRTDNTEASTDSEALITAKGEAQLELLNHRKTNTLEIEAIDNGDYDPTVINDTPVSREYDLGDMVLINVPEISSTPFSSRIVGIDETYKNGARSELKLTFGNMKKRNF